MNFSDQLLDNNLPLDGLHVVEASAGTGKTYSIQTLYLRLILLEGLAVQQILVVTFTKAATKELKERLQAILSNALLALNNQSLKPEERIEKLIARGEEKGLTKPTLVARIQQALLDFDLAAIFTIHGFCQRMLTRFAFETNQPFDTEPCENATSQIRQCCQDGWRKLVSSTDLSNPTFSFDELLQLTTLLISKPDAQVDPQVPLEKAAHDLAQSYRASRNYSQQVTFDDFLLNLRTALQQDALNPPEQQALHIALTREYQAALIDEFQDTDPIQWGIFKDIFLPTRPFASSPSAPSVPCFLVGDPKQAIYRFRNGDIETYLAATQSIPVSDSQHHHALNKNFRSEQNLVTAINQIFMDRPDEAFPSVFGDKIHYTQALGAQGKSFEESLTVDGVIDPTPFKLCLTQHLGSRSTQVPGSNSETAKEVYRITAAEIATLLSPHSTTRIAGKPIRPSQIAVLISTHAEATAVAQALRQLNIPCVQQGSGSIWATPEAQQLQAALYAILHLQNAALVRGILKSPWFDLSFEAIQALNEGLPSRAPNPLLPPLSFEDWVVLFEQWRTLWYRHGFGALFAHLDATLQLRARLAATHPTPHRCLANLAHLVERVQAESALNHFSPEATCRWLHQKIQDESANEDEKLRTESDDDAVQIMTLFYSKGLEFPIVFLPSLCFLKHKNSGSSAPIYQYHDADQVLHISTQKDSHASRAENAESEAERIRQIYVALTRASHRVVLFALLTQNTALHTPTFLTLFQSILTSPDPFSMPFRTLPGTPSAIEVLDKTNVPEASPLPPLHPAVPLSPPPPLPTINRSRCHGSFTSLSPSPQHILKHIPEAKNRDAETSTLEADTPSPASLPTSDPFDALEEPVPDIPLDPILTFPSGAKTGTCWHEIFEKIDFQIAPEDLSKRVTEQLEAYGFLADPETAPTFVEATFQMVQRVLQNPLPPLMPDVSPFSLKQITRPNRRSEWEFNFRSIPHHTTPQILEVLSHFPQYHPLLSTLQQWDQPIPGGFLTGFVDLMFRHEQRYYIVDWKSNRRTGHPEDFDATGLETEMRTHHYWLQSLVYSVALHQHLAATLPDYTYEAHFGGVYYLFLRGIQGHGSQGIYAERPPLALIHSLGSILGNFT